MNLLPIMDTEHPVVTWLRCNDRDDACIERIAGFEVEVKSIEG